MNEAEREYLRYMDSCRVYGDKIRIKTDHSLRVRDLCVDLAQDLDEHGKALAALCGLFHDAGRFEQWKRYGTYNDARSVDHGNLGREVLKESSLLDSLCEEDKETVLNAAEYHNKYSLPGTLDERTRKILHIVRDADKLDILHSCVTGELVIHTKNTAFSDTVYQALLEHRPLKRQEALTKADEAAVLLAFVFDLSSGSAYRIIKETDWFNQLIGILAKETDNQAFRIQLEELRTDINEYIRESYA